MAGGENKVFASDFNGDVTWIMLELFIAKKWPLNLIQKCVELQAILGSKNL